MAKIRTGFVSNSSSSSFMIYGVNMKGLLTKKEVQEAKDSDEYAALESVIVKKLEEYDTCLGIEHYSSGWEDERDYFVGLCPTRCKDDQTMGDFKTMIETDTKKVFGDKAKCDWHERAWYNG